MNKIYRRDSMTIKNISLTSMMIVISIILTRFFSPYIPLFGSNSFRLGLGTIPIILCSILTNWYYGLICGFFSDLIGALLFPSGAYLVGYSISSALQGLFPYFIYKLVIKNKKNTLINVFINVFISLVVFSVCTCYIVSNSSIKVGTLVIELTKEAKTTFISVLTLLTVILPLVCYFYERFQSYTKLKKSNFFAYLNIIYVNEVLIICLLGSLWKQIYFKIPFVLGFVVSCFFLLFNLFFKTFVFKTIFEVIKRAENSGNYSSSQKYEMYDISFKSKQVLPKA